MAERSTLLSNRQVLAANVIDATSSIGVGAIVNLFFPKKVNEIQGAVANLLEETVMQSNDKNKVFGWLRDNFHIDSPERAGQVANYIVQSTIGNLGNIVAGLFRFLSAENANRGQGYKVFLNGMVAKAVSVGTIGIAGLALEKNVITPLSKIISSAVQTPGKQLMDESGAISGADKFGMLAAQELVKMPMAIVFELIANRLAFKPAAQAQPSL